MILSAIKGIGPRRAASLAALGYSTVDDLLCHFPRRYEDRRRRIVLSDAKEGERVSFLAAVRSPKLIRMRGRGFSMFEATLDDGSASAPAVWYNQPYLSKTLTEGRQAWFFGELRSPRSARGRTKGPRFENPQFETFDSVDPEPIHAGRIVPIYEKIGTLTGKQLRSILHAHLNSGGFGVPEASAVPGAGARAARGAGASRARPAEGDAGEFLPADLLARIALPPREEALLRVHIPSPDDAVEDLNGASTPFHRRLIFEELFLLQLALAAHRAQLRGEPKARAYRLRPGTGAKLTSIAPFPLTEAQRRVLREIFQDLTSPHPMNRLLQGDVGSGKTIVAVTAMAFAAENGLQSALMAPTEILAGQHTRSLEDLLAGRGYRVARLVSGMRTVERREALRALASGEAQIAVGTHALLEKDVRFRRLGLVIVDEQHRFGVLQRARLAAKSHGGAPDILLMTATPIPRTLSMTLYGDLDTSLLDEMPPGRTPVDTLVKSEADRPWLYEWLSEEIARGEQAFVVYPLVEEREDLELKAAAAMARKLGAAVMRRGPTGPEPCRVGLVHGRMKGREKTDVLDAFRAGALDILVATTVIEVGIDVPSVRALVIEHADRFGLSQLHQLRGRIGRGAGGGTCVLMTGDSPTPAAQVRLAAIGRERSGFRLAEIDFGLRGPGEMLGTRQTGMPALRIAVLARDGALLDLARREAFAMIERPENEKLPQVRALLERVPRPWRERIGLSRIG